MIIRRISALILVGFCCRAAVAESSAVEAVNPVSQAVPAEALVSVLLSPSVVDAEAAGTTGSAMVGYLLQQVYESGVLGKDDPNKQLWVDIFATLPLAGQFPTGVILTDVRARPLDGGGVRLDGLRGAVVFATNGKDGPVTSHIQNLLNLRSNRTDTTLSKHTDKRGVWFELTDGRLPEFATIEWGASQGYYIIGIGKGIWGEITDTIAGKRKTLANDSWYKKQYHAIQNFCEAVGESGKPSESPFIAAPSLCVYVHARDLRKQLKSVMDEQIESILKAMKISDIDKGLWAVSVKRRDIQAASAIRIHPAGQKAEDRFIPITVPPGADPECEKAIPEDASWYTILDVSASDLVHRCSRAWLHARRESYRTFVCDWWEETVDTNGITVEDDLLGNLGHRIIIHDAPQHPLGIPLFWTILVKTNGNSERIQLALDQLMSVMQTLTTRPRLDGSARKAWLMHSPDGLWYIQLGLQGPAMGVMDDWVVISYAPTAVRENMAFLGSGKDTSKTQPQKEEPSLQE